MLELMRSRLLTPEQKEAISLARFGVPLGADTREDKATALEKRWRWLLGEVKNSGVPYAMTHGRVIDRARLAAEAPPEKRHWKPEPTVSAFTNWLMRLYASEASFLALIVGKQGEQNVVRHRAHRSRMLKMVPRAGHRGWELWLDGVRSALSEGFSIPSLQVGGKVVRGCPDLVFRERSTGRILIVELKFSEAPMPSDGWPNLRAQLWAYSRMELFAKAPEVLLAGEVWRGDGDDAVYRAGTWHCRAGDPALEKQNRALFEAYGGTVLD